MRVLDLFCGAGGAAMGYKHAGAHTLGVDIDPQPAYPDVFMHMDAIRFLEHLIDGGTWVKQGPKPGFEISVKLNDFDFIHASPPCQGYTALKAVHGNQWPLLIEPIRELIERSGIPGVIENVQGAPLRRDMVLCGEMFGLGVIRHRYFECVGWRGEAPAHVEHKGRVRGWRHGEFFDGPYVAVHGSGGGKANADEARTAMGITHMTRLHDLVEAIPPAYTEYVLREFIRSRAEQPESV